MDFWWSQNNFDHNASRNFSAQSWNCGLIHQCYNGGINVQTNGNSTPSIGENFVWINNSGFSHYMSNYTFRFYTNTSTEFNLISANFISGMSHSIMINTSLEDKLFLMEIFSMRSLLLMIGYLCHNPLLGRDIYNQQYRAIEQLSTHLICILLICKFPLVLAYQILLLT